MIGCGTRLCLGLIAGADKGKLPGSSNELIMYSKSK